MLRFFAYPVIFYLYAWRLPNQRAAQNAFETHFGECECNCYCDCNYTFCVSSPTAGIVTGVVDSFSEMMASACMLAIGISIGKCSIKEIFSDKRTYLICFFRLLGIPLFILLFIKISGIVHMMEHAKDIALVVFMATASSTSATITNLAYCYKKEEQRAGMINVMSVLFLAFTLPLMVMLYMRYI